MNSKPAQANAVGELPPPLALAIRFHETYERLAPSFGYETRPDTKQFDPESKNGRLMVAVCAELAAALSQAPRPESPAVLEIACRQASFCLRTLLPDDPDAQMTVRMLTAALQSLPAGPRDSLGHSAEGNTTALQRPAGGDEA